MSKGRYRIRTMSSSAALCAAGLFAGFSASFTGAEVGPGERGVEALEPEIVPGEIIVKFDRVPGATTLDAVRARYPKIQAFRGLDHAPHYKDQPGVPHPLAYYRIARVDEAIDTAQLAQTLTNTAGIAHAEPNGYTRTALVPNDSRYDEQYGPQIINSEAAWDITLGDSDVVIAIADTGINFDHEDLREAIWENPCEIPGNGTDDCGNGFVDDHRGWDFINNDNDPNDGNGHGSHVAGSAAARTNNAKGIAGLAQVTIMPLQVFSASGSGTWEAIAEAIFYATDNGASVLNYSGGGFGGAQVVADASTYAWENGMPVVAAAGNAGTSTEFFPAAYPEVIAVAATDRNDNRASFSNFGDWIDVAAPGVDILSCFFSGSSSYTELTGTSMSSPHCAGLVALLYSERADLTPQEVRDLLQENALDLGDPGFDPFYGHGRIDAFATLDAVGPPDCLELAFADEIFAGRTAEFTVTGGTPGARGVLVYGFEKGETIVDNVSGYCATFGIDGVTKNRVLGGFNNSFNGSGEMVVRQFIPLSAIGRTIHLQAAEQNTCPDECVTDVETTEIL